MGFIRETPTIGRANRAGIHTKHTEAEKASVRFGIVDVVPLVRRGLEPGAGAAVENQSGINTTCGRWRSPAKSCTNTIQHRPRTDEPTRRIDTPVRLTKQPVPKAQQQRSPG